MNKYNDFSKTVQQDNFFTGENCSRAEIIRILSENNDEIKPVAIINLNSIETKKEADLLLFHLTGQDGRIREAVSFAINEIDGLEKFFLDEKSKQILLNGLLDINPNVARNVISFINSNEKIKKELTPLVAAKTKDVLNELSCYLKTTSPHFENKAKCEKNHAKNKLTFNLYWLLEAISNLDVDNILDLESILTKTSCFLNYTIREKTALILSKMKTPPSQLLQKLKNDDNLYVKIKFFVINSGRVVIK